MDTNYYMGGGFRGYAPSFISSTMGTPNNFTPVANTNIVWVMGLEGAKAYPVMPGKTLFLMDSESAKFFIKAVDGNGFATVKSFVFSEEVVANAPAAANELSAAKFVTHEELQSAIEKILTQIPPAATHIEEKPKNLL